MLKLLARRSVLIAGMIAAACGRPRTPDAAATAAERNGAPPVVDAGSDGDGSVPSDAGRGSGAPDAGPAPAVKANGCLTPAPADRDWQWESPSPQGQTLRAAWAFSADDVWASGDYGALMHWDGKAWTASRMPTYESMGAIWGTGPTDVWAGGMKGTLLHCDGNGWTSAVSGTAVEIVQVWGSARNDVWALAGGYDGYQANPSTLLHWDGLAWSVVPPPSQVTQLARQALWGSSRSDVWVGGCGVQADGALASLLDHWDGKGWTETAGAPGCVTGIAGTRPDDVWATLRHPQSCPDGYGHFTPCPTFDLAHWDGKTWSRTEGPAGVGETPLSAGVPGEVWAQGAAGMGIQLHRWAAGSWSPVATLDGATSPFLPELGPRAIAGVSPRDVWLFGSTGEIQHWDGRALTGFTQKTPAFSTMWASSADEIWAVGPRTVYHRSAGAWSATDVSSLVASSAEGLSLIWGSARNDIWAVGFGVALHWDGATWKSLPVPFQFFQRTLWGSGPRDVYSGGEEGLSHFDGTAWTHVFGGDGEDVYAVWGSAATDVWMATSYYRYGEDAYANLYHFDGKSWTRAAHLWEYAQYGRIWALSGTGPNDVWAMGESRVLHWDGVAWATQNVGLPDQYGSFHVWARAPGDVWAPAAGRIGTHSAMHFDGQRWSEVPTPAGNMFFSLPDGPLWSFGEGRLVRSR